MVKEKKDKSILNKEIKWNIFSSELMVLIIMFVYGYTIALIGTGYEAKILGVAITSAIILFVLLLIELLLNIFKNKNQEEELNPDAVIFNDEVISPDDEFEKKRENEADNY